MPQPGGSAAALFRKRRRELLHEEEGRVRLAYAKRYAALRARGLSIRQAAGGVGLPITTIFKWHQRWKQRGPAALVTRTSTGRKSRFKYNLTRITPETVRAVQKLILVRGSREKAWRTFARTPACPPRLAAALRESKHVPDSLLNLVRLTVSEETFTIYRGLGCQVIARVKTRERRVRPHYHRAA